MRGRVLMIVALLSSVAMLIAMVHDMVLLSVVWAVIAFSVMYYIGKNEKELINEIDEEEE